MAKVYAYDAGLHTGKVSALVRVRKAVKTPVRRRQSFWCSPILKAASTWQPVHSTSPVRSETQTVWSHDDLPAGGAGVGCEAAFA
jgi:hypothetical protein